MIVAITIMMVVLVADVCLFPPVPQRGCTQLVQQRALRFRWTPWRRAL